MTVAHTTILDLLGKKVSFTYKESGRSFNESGEITDLIISTSGNHQISINHDEFYCLSELQDFEIAE
jgi:hypothetical protein